METQRCVVCKEIKPIEEFSFRSRLAGQRHAHCVACQKIYKRNYYLRNLEAYKEKSAREHTEDVERNRSLVREYLATHPCVDCGATDIAVLEFDHVRGKEKTISYLARAAVSWENLLAEIEKCEVRCANCHRKRTAKQFGWYKNL